MFDTQQLLQISRKMKKDEESQDRERKFVPKRLGIRMVAKENCKNVGNNFTILLITNICEMNYIVNLHTIISHQPFGISPIYNEIPCKMLARLNRQGKQQGSSATKYVIDNVLLHNPLTVLSHWQTITRSRYKVERLKYLQIHTKCRGLKQINNR